MKRYWLYAIVLLVPAALYSAGLDYGQPRPEYSPSTVQHAWLNPASVYHPDAFAYVGIAYRMLLHDDWNPHYYHNPPLEYLYQFGPVRAVRRGTAYSTTLHWVIGRLRRFNCMS